MSYCVNCGVELDKTCSVCPLCNTRVINPSMPVDTDSPGPYPSSRGTVDDGLRRDTTILVTVTMATTAVVCGLLNLAIFSHTHWSFYVIGVCAVLWICCLPLFFPTRLVIHTSLLLDGLGVAMYFGIIAWLHPGNGWYTAIALPLIALGTVMVEIFVFWLRHPRGSILVQASIFIAEIGIFTASIELLLHHYRQRPLLLSWSAVVLTCCAIIDATLITILRRSHLREAIRRRMHI